MSIKDEINFPIVSYSFVCINIPVTPPYGCLIFQYRRVCKYQSGNQNPYIEEEQTTQWPKEKSTKGQTTIYKTSTSNQRSSKTNLKTGDELITCAPFLNFPHKGLCYG
jgi:hypothetical protein